MNRMEIENNSNLKRIARALEKIAESLKKQEPEERNYHVELPVVDPIKIKIGVEGGGTEHE